MSRAEKRRFDREEKKKKTATYNLTRKQLEDFVKDSIEEKMRETRSEAYENAIGDAMALLLTIPLEVLMKFYWKKSYAKKIPSFTQHVLDYYEMWQNGELDIEEMRAHLWEYGGVRFENIG